MRSVVQVHLRLALTGTCGAGTADQLVSGTCRSA